jgi:hypothetical protein
LSEGLSIRLVNELTLEYLRQNTYPELVSRMQGLYFFENKKDARFALQYWGIPLNEGYISEVIFYPENITKVDSDWITNNFSKRTDNSWMSKYWSGEINSKKPLFEILTKGFGVIKNTELRKAAYKKIMDDYPESTALLALATCAFQYKEIDSVALIVPNLIMNNGNIQGQYFIYMDDLDNKQAEIIQAFKKSQEEDKCPPIIRPKDPDAFCRLPDLQEIGFSCDDNETFSLFRKIHM